MDTLKEHLSVFPPQKREHFENELQHRHICKSLIRFCVDGYILEINDVKWPLEPVIIGKSSALHRYMQNL